MEKKNKSFIPVILVIGVIVFAVTFAIVKFTNDSGNESSAQEYEKAKKQNERLYKRIQVNELPLVKGNADLDAPDLGESLPDISKYPAQVTNTTSDYVEIFSSTEKATLDSSGGDWDRWLIDMADEFNKAGHEVDGKPVSVMVRGIASGMAMDYISSGKYIPDAFSPSNEIWGDSLKEMGMPIELVEERLVGNVAGIVLSKKKFNELESKYGEINMETIIQAVEENELAMGYTNPLVSSTGANFLLSMLAAADPTNPLGDTAAGQFETFQANIPYVAYTTLQMKDSAKSGMMDGFVFEYQQFANSSDLRSDYIFTPFGVRHDSPLYALGDLSKDKKEILKLFAEFCKSSANQKKAEDYGFNGHDDYVAPSSIQGDILTAAQKIWKEKKDGERDIIAVFVADVSGSMEGDPLTNLKKSLMNGAKYIDNDSYIGLVTYSDNVNIALPIGQFDLTQRSYFAGAIKDMSALGGTATNDAIIVGQKMLVDASVDHPNAKLMLFVLSDGETNTGNTLSNIEGVVKGLQIPVYTIGYNADIDALQKISRINEAASIDADTEDVVYKLQSLFNAEM